MKRDGPISFIFICTREGDISKVTTELKGETHDTSIDRVEIKHVYGR
jgi:hypothetical protein